MGIFVQVPVEQSMTINVAVHRDSLFFILSIFRRQMFLYRHLLPHARVR